MDGIGRRSGTGRNELTMNRKRTIAFIVIVVICGGLSFVGTRLAAIATYTAGRDGAAPWLAEAAPSVVELEEEFSKEADGLIDMLLQEQRNLARIIEDPCTPEESILTQVENVITAHERLFRQVGDHVATLRLKLPAAQRERLMGLCAEVVRGPIGQGRGRGYGYGGGRRMGRQNFSDGGRGRGQGYGRGGGGRGYGQRQRQRGRLAQRLGLTEEQMLIAQEQDPNLDSDLTRLRNTLLTERAKLLEMFENARTGNEELLEQINKMVSAYSQIERRIARYLIVLRPYLNAEQQKWLIGLCKHNQDLY